MKSLNLNLIAGIAALIIVLGGYYWLWNTARTPSSVATTTTSQYEIGSIEKDAQNILAGLENNAGIPIGLPLQKMGRDNPFVNY